jgi:hypothetical protein
LTTPFLILVSVGWAAYILAATFLVQNGGTRR